MRGSGDEANTSRSENFSISVPPSPSPNQAVEQDDFIPPAPKKRKQAARNDIDDVLIRHLQEKSDARKQRQQETEDDHFGRHVAGVLKRLPNRMKAVARLQIEQVLMEVEFPEPESFQTYNSHYPC